jgi:hypothetical protein
MIEFLKKIPSWFWMLLASVVGAIAFIFVMLKFQKCLGFEVSYENSAAIVLAFVGIATTFIVVSNYAQVKDIERKFDSEVKGIERKFDSEVKGIERKFDEKVKEIEKKAEERRKELETLIVTAECKLSCCIHFDRAASERKNIEKFKAYIRAIASWNDAVVNENIKINPDLMDSILNRMEETTSGTIAEFVSQLIKQAIPFDGYVLEACLQTLRMGVIKNKHKIKIIDILDKVKESKNVSYKDGPDFYSSK